MYIATIDRARVTFHVTFLQMSVHSYSHTAVVPLCAALSRVANSAIQESILLDWYLVLLLLLLLRIYTKRAVRSKAVYTSTQVPFELKRYFFDRYLGVRYTSAVPRVARSVKTKLTSGKFNKFNPLITQQVHMTENGANSARWTWNFSLF